MLYYCTLCNTWVPPIVKGSKCLCHLWLHTVSFEAGLPHNPTSKMTCILFQTETFTTLMSREIWSFWTDICKIHSLKWVITGSVSSVFGPQCFCAGFNSELQVWESQTSSGFSGPQHLFQQWLWSIVLHMRLHSNELKVIHRMEWMHRICQINAV